MRVLIWYRNDLRVHDHEAIYRAIQEQLEIIPFYCFDERQFGLTSYGFPKTGKFRAKFLLESVADLRQSLESLDSNLIIRWGKPEEIIPQLVQELQIAKVYYHQEVTAEELAVEKAVNKALSGVPVQIKTFWTATLCHPDDLPFTLNQLPELFTNFRKQVERHWEIRTTYPSPKKLTKLPKIDLGNIPSLNDLGLTEPILDQGCVLSFQGGEMAGKSRIKEYIWDSDSLKTYKETRNEMLGTNYSSKFSAWLSFGCISPRYIYEEVQKYEQTRVKNDSTYWLIFELLWRDFFRFICSKHGHKIFYKSGLQELYLPWLEDWERFNLWCEGKTGYPLVDANMRELAATGFMSNRGRQNVASFLTKNLGIDWCMGAEWFESLLIDYDVCSNWGNWNYTAGVGNDARGFRYFNIPKQSRDYDPKGDYLRHWLPELALIKGDKIHEPYKLSPEEQKRYTVILGVNYPRPIVDFFQSIKHNEKIYLQHFSNQ
ncbi:MULTISPECIES: DASH family cryptochrome [Microcystis]|uniref:Cryptochrome DASH n=2 Tax=Microcystis TaxID=1125 RepID=A0A841ULJ9_MICAE|nr:MULTISPECIES: DASH family cryptochrome [Microcystis]AKV65962.1 Cryptochrome [Microcystis panniformis FACHB-1757]MBC1191851.1 DASH family cryptochrome [Microcystis aeruginosa BLCC-F108]MCA2591281.1 DASH family cryptochrome [Microcystis sp. M31BS1]MDB9410864.1 DASH family cryptochrome [Microcystis aeruginosa CS-558/01A06]